MAQWVTYKNPSGKDELGSRVAAAPRDGQRQDVLLQAGAVQKAILASTHFSVIATDEKGVIRLFNVGAERMLGYVADKVVHEMTPAHVCDAQEVIARARALSLELGIPIAAGFEALVFKASRGIEDVFGLTYIRNDGSRVPATVSVTALRDADGAIVGYLLIGIDHAAGRQAEVEQQKIDHRVCDQQSDTRSLIESYVDALMTTDAAGILTDVNKQAEALTGCTRDELIGTPFKSYFTDPEKADAAVKLALRDKRVTHYALTARAKDGKTTVVSYSAITFYDADGTLRGVFAAARDVTERKRVEKTLQNPAGSPNGAKPGADRPNATKSDGDMLGLDARVLESLQQARKDGYLSVRFQGQAKKERKGADEESWADQ